MELIKVVTGVRRCGKSTLFIVRTKIKNLISGRVLERTYDSGEKLKEPDFEEKRMQYLYNDGIAKCIYIKII